ncbi:MAG: trypsin-like peptidase domain-containing protein [Gemmatimonadaceae bacterium]|nr:trypsin-like peptidase domain-containing protein [Gemmatimonadaceae bacterium]
MSISTNRARLIVAVIIAFVGGLIVASGMGWTHLGFAQGKPSAATLQPINDASNAFVAIANQVTPAVVAIEVSSTARASTQRPRTEIPQGLPPDMQEFFKQFGTPQQQQPRLRRGSGSGFVVTRDGYILTNNHVVTNPDHETVADQVIVRLMDHRVFTAKVVGHDRTTDIAVLKIDGNDFPTMSLGNDAGSRIGEWVLAIGNPLGLDFTVTAGIISAKGRSLGNLGNEDGSNRYQISDLIQTDAAINPGNSGGPLVNSRGEVIGINSALASATGYYEGFGFAIPITLAKRVMDEIIAHGRVRIPALRVQIVEVKPEDAAVAGMKDIRGALVQNFPDDESPAKKAGIQPGDIIITADGQAIDRVSTLQRVVRNHSPGERISVEVMRYGQKKSFDVKLAEADTDTKVAAASAAVLPASTGTTNKTLGISVASLTPQLAQSAKISSARGIVVTDVTPLGPAQDKLQERDVITEVIFPAPRRAINTPGQLQEAIAGLKNGQYISLSVFNLDDPGHTAQIVNLRVGQ